MEKMLKICLLIVSFFFEQKISDFGSFRHPPSEIRRHPAPNPRKFEILKKYYFSRTNEDANNLKTKLSRKLLLEHFYITCSLVGSVFPRDSESLIFLATYFSPIDCPSKISKISKFGRKINISLYQNLDQNLRFFDRKIFFVKHSGSLVDAHGRSWTLMGAHGSS